jgi:hypothetical protein
MRTCPAPATDYIGLISLLVAVASCIASIVAAVFAKHSVAQAEQAIAQAKQSSEQSLAQSERVALREHDEWMQRKWYELYFKAAEALDSLDYFRTKYRNARDLGTEDRAKDWSEMMFKVRAAGRMAFVFPQNPIVTAFIASAAGFRDSQSAMSEEHYKKMDEAVEGLRENALLNPSVLLYRPYK